MARNPGTRKMLLGFIKKGLLRLLNPCQSPEANGCLTNPPSGLQEGPASPARRPRKGFEVEEFCVFLLFLFECGGFVVLGFVEFWVFRVSGFRGLGASLTCIA